MFGVKGSPSVSSSCVSAAASPPAASSITVTWCPSEVAMFSCGKKSQIVENQRCYKEKKILPPLVSLLVKQWTLRFHPSRLQSPLGYFQYNL